MGCSVRNARSSPAPNATYRFSSSRIDSGIRVGPCRATRKPAVELPQYRIPWAALERLLRPRGTEAAMGRMLETRAARLARKTLVDRREKLQGLAARLRRGADELQGRRPDQLDRAADLEPHDVLEALQAAEASDLAEVE